MYMKTCPTCHQPSFSSSKLGEWNCPICNNDLSSLSARDAAEVFQSTLSMKYITPPQTDSHYHPTFETYI
ncbi:hypothetical protein [Ferdinandcohnia sp. Marseille-Q9671]